MRTCRLFLLPSVDTAGLSPNLFPLHSIFCFKIWFRDLGSELFLIRSYLLLDFLNPQPNRLHPQSLPQAQALSSTRPPLINSLCFNSLTTLGYLLEVYLRPWVPFLVCLSISVSGGFIALTTPSFQWSGLFNQRMLSLTEKKGEEYIFSAHLC